MLEKWFNKKKQINIFAPVSGTVLRMEDVPDPTFSKKMIGEGIAIRPIEGRLLSPVDGEIIQVFPTGHALGIKTKEGIEILLHIGIDTVMMKGEGFTTHVQKGDYVTQGQLLVEFCIEKIKEYGKDPITPLVITNGNLVKQMKYQFPELAKAGENIILTLTTK